MKDLSIWLFVPNRSSDDPNKCHFGDDCGWHAIAGCLCGKGVCSSHASGDPESSWQRHIRECTATVRVTD